jgi:hypothetical protein
MFIDACEVAIGKFPEEATIDAIDTTPIFVDDITADATDTPLANENPPAYDPTNPYIDDTVIEAWDVAPAATPEDIVAEAIDTTPILAEDISAEAIDAPLTAENAPLNLAAPTVNEPT